MKKIVIISDTHSQHWKLKIPKCDILIHCGDMDIQNINDLEDIDEWFGLQPSKHNICIPGNHDRFLEKEDKYFVKNKFNNTHLLIHDFIKKEGLWFFGSPYTPAFNNWSFEYQRCSPEANQIWSAIPENLDFFITHGPSYGILDKNPYDKKCGCEVLSREIFKNNPKYHVFGHIHRFGGTVETKEHTTFINASVLDEDYKLKNNPIILEI